MFHSLLLGPRRDDDYRTVRKLHDRQPVPKEPRGFFSAISELSFSSSLQSNLSSLPLASTRDVPGTVLHATALSSCKLSTIGYADRNSCLCVVISDPFRAEKLMRSTFVRRKSYPGKVKYLSWRPCLPPNNRVVAFLNLPSPPWSARLSGCIARFDAMGGYEVEMPLMNFTSRREE